MPPLQQSYKLNCFCLKFLTIPRNTSVSFPLPKFSFLFLLPNIGNAISHSCSHSQKLGMQFFIPIPVTKIWEWAEVFPFPFPKSKKSFPFTQMFTQMLPKNVKSWKNAENYHKLHKFLKVALSCHKLQIVFKSCHVLDVRYEDATKI